MKIWDWFSGLFNKDGTLSIDVVAGEITTEIYYKELAIQACVNLISNVVSRGEFLTFDKGKEDRGHNYYLFNIEPNQNKSASKFWRDVIYKLVYKNNCLVIKVDGKFYAADSFDRKKFAFKDNIYTNIVIDDYELKEAFYEPEVFYFELHNEKIKTVIDGLYSSYAKLIEVSSNGYKKDKVKRGKLNIPSNYPQADKAQEDLNDLMDRRLKRFYEASGNAVLPLTNGITYDEVEGSKGNRSGIEGRETRAFIDDIFDFSAMGFQISPSLIKGDVADTGKAMNDLLTICVNPIAEEITDEINRKYYREEAYLERSYVKLDTSKIKVTDLKEIANALDVLTRIGAYSVDDSLKTLGMEPLNTEWSKARWMTKNYERIEARMKGGE